MNDNKKPQDNVIQFPGRKKEAEKNDSPATPKNQSTPPPAPKPEKDKKTMAAGVLAVLLMTVAVNRYTFDAAIIHKTDMASFAQTANGRAIASLDRASWNRDAAWEKRLAEKLASPQVRSTASLGIGRSATKEEKLRWGILEEKYTINYTADDHKINSILLQDTISSPAYILDRSKFLKEYGHLFQNAFETAKLKSTEKSSDKTVENYTLFDKENRPKGEARFELDRHKRLISLKVEPVQI